MMKLLISIIVLFSFACEGEGQSSPFDIGENTNEEITDREYSTDGSSDTDFELVYIDSDSDSDIENNIEEKRLKAVSYTGEDGSIFSQDYFWDTELEIFCMIGTHIDGSLRCLPFLYQAFASTYFSDSLCYNKIGIDFYSDSFSEAPAYILETIEGNQDTRIDPIKVIVYERGSSYNGEVYMGSRANCVEATLSFDKYEIGSEVLASIFVEFERGME